MPRLDLTPSPLRLTQFRYLAVVGSAAFIDLFGFAALQRLPIPVPVAAATSFLAAAVYNYNMSARFVFRQAPQVGRLGLFLLVGMVGLSVNTGVTWWASVAGAADLVAKAAGIGVAFVVNTLLNVSVVFRRGGRWLPRAPGGNSG